GDGSVGVAVGTGPAAAGQAVLAAPTGEEILVDDPVALLERLAIGVGGDALAQLLDVAGHLVTVVARQRPVPLARVELPTPDVQVRSTDVGERHPHQGGARLRVWHRVLAD